MKPPVINADEFLKSMAAEAVKQREQIRTAIRDLTLEALQIRELSLKQINNVVRNISVGVNLGVGDAKVDTGKALSEALAGMDDGSQQGCASQANRWRSKLRGFRILKKGISRSSSRSKRSSLIVSNKLLRKQPKMFKNNGK